MPPIKTGTRKKAKYLDLKLLIASLALAVTIGIWNLLSYNAVLAEKAAAEPPAQPDPNNMNQPAEALPTLVPLVEISIPTQTAPLSPIKSSPQGLGPNQPLREVSAPTQVVVQKIKPLIQQQVQVSLAGGGGGVGSAPKPVTTTSSSHP